MQVKRAGRYRGPLVIFTVAQCWVDFEGSVEVPGYISDDDFPLAALALSATSVSSFVCTVIRSTHGAQVHRALWLWANGYITKESYEKAQESKRGGTGILKALGPDGKPTKTTNFSKDQWDEISSMHVRDAWSVEREKLQVIRGDIDKAVDTIRNHKLTKRKANAEESDRLAKKSWGSCFEHRIASSDSDVWYVSNFLHCYTRSNTSNRFFQIFVLLFFITHILNNRSLRKSLRVALFSQTVAVPLQWRCCSLTPQI